MQTLQLVILFTLFLLTVWLFFLNSRANPPSWAALEYRRYAHRGLHCSADSVPETSLAAFRRAIRHGYGAELDVHLLRDGTLAVFHDSDLKRMTGVTGVLEDCTAQDLAALHLASTPETIPQLCEVLSLYEARACRSSWSSRAIAATTARSPSARRRSWTNIRSPIVWRALTRAA